MKRFAAFIVLTCVAHVHAMDHDQMPKRVTAVIDTVENNSLYRITMSLSGITTVIEKGETKQNLHFEIPVNNSHNTTETFIYVDSENRPRLSLAAILNQPERLGKQTLREFVVKFSMLYPKFFKNEHWQWRNSYFSDFLERGDNHWTFKISIEFKGNNLEETELYVAQEVKTIR